jgi:formate hydrogenlyase subunit 3/multisubunit Na+/H+ antiporter MnhD subunit
MSLLSFLLLALLLLSLLAGLLRRIPLLAGLMVAGGLAWLAWGLWRAPLEGNIEMLGRTLMQNRPNQLLTFSFQLTPAIRAPILLLLFWGAIFTLIAALIKTERSFYPAIPILLAALILFLSSAPLLWAPIWLMLAAVIMAFIAQGNKPRSARAALRTLLAPILAFPFFLFAAWVFSQSAVAADDPRLWNNAWKALIIGMLILTSPVPLHGWITALGESSPAFAGAFLVGVWQIAIYTFIRRLLFTYPAITNFADPGLWLPWIAVIQMLWAGAFMFGSQRLGQLWGYLLLWMYGAAFLAWGLTGELGSEAIFWLFLVNPLVLTLAAAGMQSIVHRFGENPAYEKLHGVSDRLPLSALGFIAGGLFLLGWPLGALFPMRLATYQVAEYRAGNIFLWTMVALALGVLGLIRAARHLTSPVRDVTLEREPRIAAWTIGILLAAGGVIALHPGLLTPIAEQMLIWFNML